MNDLAAALSFALGLAFGSFLNVCISRLPQHRSVITPRSACPTCGSAIAFYDNIPLLSWVLLRGRCRSCGSGISPRYVVVELVTGLLFAWCVWHYGITLSAGKYCVFGFLLIGLIFTDAETKLLPNTMTLSGLALGLMFSLIVPVNDVLSHLGLLHSTGTAADNSWRLGSLADSLLGAAVGASFIYGIGMLYKLWRGVEGMGFGDVKLMAMIGAFLGVRLSVFTLFTASIAGSIFGLCTVAVVWVRRTRRLLLRRRRVGTALRRAWGSANIAYRYYQMPFGVFLGGMALVALLYGHQFLAWYWGTMGGVAVPRTP